MTLVSEIISDALRQSNLLAIGVSPTTAQYTEGLRYLNRLAKSVLGFEVGDPLRSFPLGADNIFRPSGFPSWGSDPGACWFVPANVRLILNLTESLDLYLPPMPEDGARFAVNDMAASLTTYPVTVKGNGYLIEGAETLTLSNASIKSEWLFRADTGNWARISPLLEGDTFPYPEEFDDFFLTMLAARLNPSYGAALDPQSQMMLARARGQMRARYRQTRQMPSELGLIRLPLTFAGRDEFFESQPNFGDAPR